MAAALEALVLLGLLFLQVEKPPKSTAMEAVEETELSQLQIFPEELGALVLAQLLVTEVGVPGVEQVALRMELSTLTNVLVVQEVLVDLDQMESQS